MINYRHRNPTAAHPRAVWFAAWRCALATRSGLTASLTVRSMRRSIILRFVRQRMNDRATHAPAMDGHSGHASLGPSARRTLLEGEGSALLCRFSSLLDYEMQGEL